MTAEKNKDTYGSSLAVRNKSGYHLEVRRCGPQEEDQNCCIQTLGMLTGLLLSKTQAGMEHLLLFHQF